MLSFFTGFLISDGYSAYQQLLPQLAGVQQCCQHIIRRCRAVTKLGPGSLQSWAADVIEILRKAHKAVDEALASGDPALDTELLAKLRERYDEVVAFGITRNRHRDWHDGNHPGFALASWLRDCKEQVWLFTRELAIEWTNNSSDLCRTGQSARLGVADAVERCLVRPGRRNREHFTLVSASRHVPGARGENEVVPGYRHGRAAGTAPRLITTQRPVSPALARFFTAAPTPILRRRAPCQLTSSLAVPAPTAHPPTTSPGLPASGSPSLPAAPRRLTSAAEHLDLNRQAGRPAGRHMVSRRRVVKPPASLKVP